MAEGLMDELVRQLAALQTEQKAEEDARDDDKTVISLRAAVADAKGRLEMAKKALEDDLAYYEPLITGTIRDIETIEAQIIDEWSGEKKTMIFDAGTLKFRQTGSLKIYDELYIFSELYDHIKLGVLIEKYMKGFNLTAVKKYMGVHELPIDVAEIEYKTTVKLEQKE